MPLEPQGSVLVRSPAAAPGSGGPRGARSTPACTQPQPYMGDSTVSSAIRIFPALSCACELERGEGKEQDGCFASMRSAGTTVSSAVRKQFCTSAQLSIKRVDLSSLVHVSEVIDHQWGACSLEEKLLDLILQILVCVFCFVLKSLST